MYQNFCEWLPFIKRLSFKLLHAAYDSVSVDEGPRLNLSLHLLEPSRQSLGN